MNLRNIKPQNLIAAAALVAPIAMVQCVRMLFGSGPEQASAMTSAGDVLPAPEAPTLAPAQGVTPRQKAAAEHLAQLRGGITIFKSPFNRFQQQIAYQPADTVMPITDPLQGEPVRTDVPLEVRSLSVGALMRNEHGPFAMVAGKVRTVGDVVIPGWSVTAIDPELRRVTITSEEGVSVNLTRAD